MGTLYLVGAPAGDPDDITLRALRILRQVDLVVGDDAGHAGRLLARHGISTPLVATADLDALPDALAASDVALLIGGRSAGPSGAGQRLIHAAIERGFPTVPVPGPCLPLTALVVSGLPADSFVYLGELPGSSSARRDLLASIAGERRTLIIVEAAHHLPGTLADLRDALGDRPLAVVAAAERGVETLWRGALGEAAPPPLAQLPQPWLVLVVGGAPEQAVRWDEERLRAEIQTRLEGGLPVKEISRQLAAEAGWPRREIYRLAVEIAQFRPDG